MDVLSDVLQAVRLKGAVFFDVRGCEPIAAATPSMALVGRKLMPSAEQVIPFHIMMRGSCWVESTESDDAPAELCEGDIVFYPHGHGHIFVTNLGDRADPDLRHYVRSSDIKLPVIRNLETRAPWTTRFVCGYLGCNTAPFNPLLETLPSQVISKRPVKGNHIEVDLIQAAVEESESRRAGGETILARLSELLFVRVLRRHIEQMPENSSGWLAGLRDANTSEALRLIHADPAHDWSVEELSRKCGMSRAAFAERFSAIVGETPMRYLGRWRMQLASRLLEQPGMPIEAIAEEVGYRSEAAFNRAFKNIVGQPPGVWRRAQGRARPALEPV
jgi:AraC-like DNA-binding protein